MADPYLSYVVLLSLALSPAREHNSAELAGKIKHGDHAAFRTFFEAHHQSLFRFLVSKGIARDAAQDLIQKAFMYIWENRQKIEPKKSLRAYLFRIGYTRMLNHIRDNKKFNSTEKITNTESTGNPETDLRARELQEAIDKAIAAMPQKRGMVFEMCFIQEFTYRETARALEISKKTVENHMGLAFKDLRAALDVYKPETENQR